MAESVPTELYTALRKVALSGQLSPGRVVRVAERERERERGGVEFQFRFNAVCTQREIVKKPPHKSRWPGGETGAQA